MIPVTPELAAAIEAPERRPLVRLSVDWDRDGHGPAGSLDDLTPRVGEVQISRAVTGDLPDSVRLIEGSAAAALDADLVTGDTRDERRHAAWYFSRTNPASPLAGKERLARPARADIGFLTATGPRYVRRFTGSTRALPASARDRTARLLALDGRERMRGPLTLPPLNGEAAGANGTWLVSYALHQSGIPASPPPRPGCRLWMPMHGSTRAMVGGDENVWSQPHLTGLAPRTVATVRPQFVPGPFSLGADAGIDPPSLDGEEWRQLNGALALVPGRSLYAQNGASGRLELWVRGDPTGAPSPRTEGLLRLLLPTTSGFLRAAIRDDRRLYFRVNDGQFEDNVNSTLTLPADGAWHFVGFAWDLATSPATFTFRVDTQGEGWFAGFSDNHLPPTENWNTAPFFYSFLPVAELQLSSAATVPPAVPWLNDLPFTAGAVLDRSLLDLVAVAEPEPVEAWGLVSELAAAEQAVAYFDENDVFQYRTRVRLVGKAAQTVQRTLTAETSILDLDVDDRIDAVRNVVHVGYTTPRLGFGIVHESRDLHTLQPRETLRLWIDLTARLVGVVFPELWAPGEPEPAPSTWVTPNTRPDGTGTKPRTVTARIATWTAGSVLIEVRNTGSSVVYLANNAGRPTVRVAGQFVTTVGGTATSRDARSVTEFGEQPLDVPANRWVQRRDVAAGLADALTGDLAWPHAVLTGLVIIGDPRLQLGDRIRVRDTNGVVLDGQYWLASITDRISPDRGYTQHVTARRATTVLRWDAGTWDGFVWGE